MIKAIETQYKGYIFRSRLETRWAVFFDEIGLTWEYEPEGFDLGNAGWYLPDFRVGARFDNIFYVEVKPENTQVDDKFNAFKEAMNETATCVLVSGDPMHFFQDGYIKNINMELLGFMCHGCGLILNGKCWDKHPSRGYEWYCHNCDIHFDTGDSTFSVFNKSVHIRHHKGFMIIDSHSETDEANKPIEIAYKKARSVRFEHGKAP
jgi:hypothetical protein